MNDKIWLRAITRQGFCNQTEYLIYSNNNINVVVQVKCIELVNSFNQLQSTNESWMSTDDNDVFQFPSSPEWTTAKQQWNISSQFMFFTLRWECTSFHYVFCLFFIRKITFLSNLILHDEHSGIKVRKKMYFHLMFICREFITIYVHEGKSPIMQKARWAWALSTRTTNAVISVSNALSWQIYQQLLKCAFSTTQFQQHYYIALHVHENINEISYSSFSNDNERFSFFHIFFNFEL